MKMTLTLTMKGAAPRIIEHDADPDNPTPVAFYPRQSNDEPDIFVARDEVRAANGRLDLVASVGAGSLHIDGPFKAEMSWDAIDDGSAEYTRLKKYGPETPRSYSSDVFRDYLTQGLWVAGVSTDIGPLPDTGDPGAPGSSRMSFIAPNALRALACRTDTFENGYGGRGQTFTNLYEWTRDNWRRPCHYYDADGHAYIDDGVGRIGTYRSRGGMVSSWGRGPKSYSTGFVPDPMHLTVISLLGYAVFGESYMAGRCALDQIEAAMTHTREGMGVKPPRWYGCVLNCIGQAIIALEPFFPADCVRLRAHMRTVLKILDGHAESDAHPVMDNVSRGDHFHISEAMDDAAQAIGYPLTKCPEYGITWMLGVLAGGIGTCLYVPSLDDETHKLLVEHGRRVGDYLSTTARLSKNPFYRDFKTLKAVDDLVPYNQQQDGGRKTDFAKNVAPDVNLVRIEEKSSLRGVYADFLLPGMEMLARTLPGEGLVSRLNEACDSLIDSMHTYGWGFLDPEQLANGAWFDARARRGQITE